MNISFNLLKCLSCSMPTTRCALRQRVFSPCPVAGQVAHVEDLFDRHQISRNGRIQTRRRSFLIAGELEHVGEGEKNTLINTHLANQMTQVKDRKIEICFHHPSALFILVIEKICAHISPSFHFVMDYGTLSNLFMASLFSFAT